MITVASGHSLYPSSKGALDTVVSSRSETKRRERIAQDLRDNAIGRIFAVGVGMTALAAGCADPKVQRRLADYVGELDLAVSAVYAAVAELTRSESRQEGSHGD